MITIKNRTLAVSVSVVVAASVWGVYWIPARFLNALGMRDVWITFFFFLFGSIFLILFSSRFRHELTRGNLLTGFFVGGAFVLYGVSVITTQVVTALLLFYITPLWSTMLGCILLKERLTTNRVLGLALGITGLFIILGHKYGFPIPRNLGDWFALGSGISWAYGTVRIYREPATSTLTQTFVFFAGGLAAAVVVILLPIDGIGNMPSANEFAKSSLWVLLVTVIYLPTMLVILWGARMLSPGRVGLLLMSDLIVGVISAALLAGEPFGWREILGTCLIASAAVVEVLGFQNQEPDSTTS